MVELFNPILSWRKYYTIFSYQMMKKMFGKFFIYLYVNIRYNKDCFSSFWLIRIKIFRKIFNRTLYHIYMVSLRVLRLISIPFLNFLLYIHILKWKHFVNLNRFSWHLYRAETKLFYYVYLSCWNKFSNVLPPKEAFINFIMS